MYHNASTRRFRSLVIAQIAVVVFAFCTRANADSQQPSDVPFPYTLTTTRDVALSIVSASVFTSGMIVSYSVAEISAPEIADLNADDVNRLDKTATRRWSPASNAASYVTATASALLPLALPAAQFSQRRVREGITLGVMYLQAMGITIGTTGIVKGIAQRERPFLYNDSLSLEEKMDESGTRKSFYSQHTAMAFCSGVFLAKAFSDMHPHSGWRFVIWPSSLLLAGSTGLLRFTAGKHFPTDILIGGLAGSLFGYLIPLIHRSKLPNAVALYPLAGEVNGVGAWIRF
ncbi:MAG: phosphatase PAP2 family protein [Deltaproteobacteria bacterium]|nr:phosphatase PAP2 family protein [Deltaproteobacteria bacterium]MBN2670875.1 phosphatase PAP2 family protein [Deltaproteobacteria bacterium]